MSSPTIPVDAPQDPAVAEQALGHANLVCVQGFISREREMLLKLAGSVDGEHPFLDTQNPDALVPKHKQP